MEFVLLPHEYSVETLRDRAVTPEGHPRHLVHADGVEDDELNGVERGRREHGENEDAVVLLGGAGAGHEDGLGDEVAGVLPRDDVARRRVDLQDLERGERRVRKSCKPLGDLGSGISAVVQWSKIKKKTSSRMSNKKPSTFLDSKGKA